MTINKKNIAIAATLLFAMVLTRAFHFGTHLHLPDASLAAFFLGGFYLRRYQILPLFLIAAGLSDYFSIQNGASAWCVSPAYSALIPTYAALWFGGRWLTTLNSVNAGFSQHNEARWKALSAVGVALFLSGSLAFLISNGSFYLFSGRFAELSWLQYSSRVAQYYAPYMSGLLFYMPFAAVIHLIAYQISADAPKNRTVYSNKK